MYFLLISSLLFIQIWFCYKVIFRYLDLFVSFMCQFDFDGRTMLNLLTFWQITCYLDSFSISGALNIGIFNLKPFHTNSYDFPLVQQKKAKHKFIKTQNELCVWCVRVNFLSTFVSFLITSCFHVKELCVLLLFSSHSADSRILQFQF